VARRQSVAERLTEGVKGLAGVTPPEVRRGCRHVYYVWALRFDEAIVGISREIFSEALAAEGFPHTTGYQRPLYLLPLFQKRVAFGSEGYPFNLSAVQYPKGLCPVTERMYERELICYETCAHDLEAYQVDLLAEALHKVYACRDDLTAVA
jgi:perosamine synthetase